MAEQENNPTGNGQESGKSGETSPGTSTGGNGGGSAANNEDPNLPDWVKDPSKFDPKRAYETIQNLRKFETDAKKLEGDLANVSKKLKEYEDRDKTEAQRLTDRAETAENRVKELEAEVHELKAQGALAEAGAIRPKLLVRELSADVLTDTEKLTSAIASLKTNYPELFRPAHGNGDAGVTERAAVTTDMNDLIRRAAGRTVS